MLQKPKWLILLVAILTPILAGCAAAVPAYQDYNGLWVVDMEASRKINSAIDEATAEFMSHVVMAIDMEQRTMTVKYEDDEATVVFTVIAHDSSGLTIKDGPHIMRLTLKESRLEFSALTEPRQRDDFVFIRPQAGDSRPDI
jgi:hypothetical protein